MNLLDQRVVGVNPGGVETERMTIMMNTSDALRQRMTELPARRARPREVADMMGFLASDRSSGVIVTIDGGFCAGWFRP